MSPIFLLQRFSITVKWFCLLFSYKTFTFKVAKSFCFVEDQPVYEVRFTDEWETYFEYRQDVT